MNGMAFIYKHILMLPTYNLTNITLTSNATLQRTTILMLRYLSCMVV